MDDLIDWHAILTKYIRHVGRSEGVDFLGNGEDPNPCSRHHDEPCFTEAELDAILEVARG